MDFFSTLTIFDVMSEQTPKNPGAIFARVIQGLMRPLVRALIAQGITAPAFYRILKRVYVEVAEESFQIDGTRQTDSRISMLTGVHRRDVREFRGADTTASDAAHDKVTTIASVLGRWLANPSTRDKFGQPRPLPKSGDSDLSFESLVRSVSKDIRPRTVLDELERQSLVYQEDGLIHLRADAFLGPADPDQKVYFFAENVGDHIAAAVDNLLADEPRFLERAVFYNRLTPQSIDEIEAEARRIGGDALIELNQLAHARQDADLDAPNGTQRFRFGMFFYRTDESKNDTTTARDDENT